MELPAGIVVLERGWLSSNNILLIGRDHSALVDSGYWLHTNQTTALVQASLNSCPLNLLLNTHLHSDHCGGNAALQKQYPEMRTRIPAGLASHVQNWDPVALTYEPTGQYCPRFRFDDLLRPGTELRLGDLLWQIHAAPGHDPHSVILFEPTSRTLISADALWQNGFGVVFQELEGEQAFDEVAATLDVIERLAPRLVIPGHGCVFDEVAPALTRARQRLEGFVRDPQKHAQHAAKVLLKFKLLELQRVRCNELIEWAAKAHYFSLVHNRHFAELAITSWIEELAESLIRSGAARRDGEYILN